MYFKKILGAIVGDKFCSTRDKNNVKTEDLELHSPEILNEVCDNNVNLNDGWCCW